MRFSITSMLISTLSSTAASGGTLKIDYLFVVAEPAKANPDLADHDGFEGITSQGVRLIHHFRDAIEDLLRWNNNDRPSDFNLNFFLSKDNWWKH